MNNGTIEAIKLIEAVLRGEIADSRDFSRRVAALPAFTEQSEVAVALHQAQHYVTDADIFSTDPDYQRLQKKKLVKLVQSLKAK